MGELVDLEKKRAERKARREREARELVGLVLLAGAVVYLVRQAMNQPGIRAVDVDVAPPHV